MGGDFKDVGGPVAGLLANLSMCNATVDFESLQELLRSLPNLELSHLKFNNCKRLTRPTVSFGRSSNKKTWKNCKVTLVLVTVATLLRDVLLQQKLNLFTPTPLVVCV